MNYWEESGGGRIRSWMNREMDICWSVLFFSFIFKDPWYFPLDIKTRHLKAFVSVNMRRICVHLHFFFSSIVLKKFTRHFRLIHGLAINMLVFELERVVLCVIVDCKLNCLTSEEISYSLKSNPFLVSFISFFLFIQSTKHNLHYTSSHYFKMFIAFTKTDMH